MKYYRFISESKIEPYDKGYAVVENVQISNPSAEVLLRIGVKPLIEDPMPEYDENKEAIEFYFVEHDTEIVKKWRIVGVIDDESANA